LRLNALKDHTIDCFILLCFNREEIQFKNWIKRRSDSVDWTNRERVLDCKKSWARNRIFTKWLPITFSYWTNI